MLDWNLLEGAAAVAMINLNLETRGGVVEGLRRMSFPMTVPGLFYMFFKRIYKVTKKISY